MPDGPGGTAGVISRRWGASGARRRGGPGKDVGQVETGRKEQRGCLHQPDRDRRRGSLHRGSHGGPDGCGTRAVAPAGAGTVMMGMGRRAGSGCPPMDMGHGGMPLVSMVPVDGLPVPRFPMLVGPMLVGPMPVDPMLSGALPMDLSRASQVMVRTAVEAADVHHPPAQEGHKGQRAEDPPPTAGPGHTPQGEAKGRGKGPGILHDSRESKDRREWGERQAPSGRAERMRSTVPHGSGTVPPSGDSSTGWPWPASRSSAAPAASADGTWSSHSRRRASASPAGGAPAAQVFSPRW